MTLTASAAYTLLLQILIQSKWLKMAFQPQFMMALQNIMQNMACKPCDIRRRF